MDNIATRTVRIGVVNYLNTAPILERWKQSVAVEHWQLVEAAPSVLCRQLAAGEIDLGFVSSYEYGLHPHRYKMLSGLSISASGPVGSVFLFSHRPIEQLGGGLVLLTTQSETSVRLVQIILEVFHKVKPKYCRAEISETDLSGVDAVLAIGDEALRLVHNSSFVYHYDLGEIWKRQTDLPFVFAVCAVREEFCQERPQELAAIHRELLRCCKEGKSELSCICDLCAERIPMDRGQCFNYLSAIEYDLSAPKRQALEAFFSYLIDRNEIDKTALPLKLFTETIA